MEAGSRPVLAFPVVVDRFSGRPVVVGGHPTDGLLGKVYIVLAGIEAGTWLLLIVLVISSIIGIYYNMRLTLMMFRNRPADQPALTLQAMSRLSGAMLLVLSGLVVWWGIYPTSFIQFIQALMI